MQRNENQVIHIKKFWMNMQKDNTKLSMIKNIIHLYTVEWFVGDAYFKDNMGHPYPLADLYQQICYKAMN